MNPRLFLIALIAALALAGLPALAQAPAPATANAMPAVPPHNCVAPEYPGKDASKLRVDKFNQDYKTYGDCMKKYVDDTNKWVKAAAELANKAIDEYNRYTEDLKKRIEGDK